MPTSLRAILIGGLALACGGCVAEPAPMPMAYAPPAQAAAAPPPQDCREYQQTVTVGGQPQQAIGTSCRQPDGTWKLMPAQTADATAGAPVVAAPPPAVAYPAYPYYPGYYAYPGYYGPPASVGIGFRFGGHFH